MAEAVKNRQRRAEDTRKDMQVWTVLLPALPASTALVLRYPFCPPSSGTGAGGARMPAFNCPLQLLPLFISGRILRLMEGVNVFQGLIENGKHLTMWQTGIMGSSHSVLTMCSPVPGTGKAKLAERERKQKHKKHPIPGLELFILHFSPAVQPQAGLSVRETEARGSVATLSKSPLAGSWMFPSVLKESKCWTPGMREWPSSDGGTGHEDGNISQFVINLSKDPSEGFYICSCHQLCVFCGVKPWGLRGV